MRFKGSGVVLFLLAVLAFASCKDPEDIGLDVLPAGEQMPIAWIDTFTIEARTVYYDSVPTSTGTYFLIGDFGDPIFGPVRSNFYTKFEPQQSDYNFGSSYADSVFLNLTYAGYYGNADKLKGIMTFGVYEVTDDLVSTDDTTYYSNSNPTLGDQIGEITFRPDLYSDVVTGEDTLSPGLRIPLHTSFGQRILDESNTSSSEAFWETFKGLAVKPMAPSMPGFGSILYFDMDNADSRLELFYHNATDSALVVFDIAKPNGLHTRFEHDYSSEILSAIADSTVAGATKLYTQSMAGLRMKLLFPHIRELNSLGVVAINKAELVVPVDVDVASDYDLPSSLSVNGIKEGDTATFLIDYFEGTEYYGGTLDEDNNEYVFNIARYVQGLLNSPTETDYGLFIANFGNAVNARRGVYNGPQHPDRPMKLRITYTIIE